MNAHAADAGHHDEHHVHVMPMSIYMGVYGALLILTVLTVAVSRYDITQLGIPASLGIPIAMAIAVVKGSLVVAYFMHLRYDIAFIQLIFFASVFFMLVFFAWTMVDLSSRAMLHPENGLYSWREAEGLVVDAPSELTEEGHHLPAAYVNQELYDKKHAGHHGGGHHDDDGHGKDGHGKDGHKDDGHGKDGHKDDGH